MTASEDLKAKAERTYNSAADSYDANSFWDRFGRRTIDRLGLAPGSRVLDVCCGSGASALPAAEIVGPGGSVLGVDLAGNLLHLAREKSLARGLGNVEFRAGDMLDLDLPAGGFDAVVCVFGVFFAPDMPAAVRALWGHVRLGGQLAITTWGPRFFEPASSVFWGSVRDVRPDLHKGFNPWDRVCDPQSLHALFAQAGVGPCEVEAEMGTHTIPSPDAWWSAVMGSGYRGTVEQLSESERVRVREANIEWARRTGRIEVEANVVYAVARKG